MIDVSALFPEWSIATATLPDLDGNSTVTLRHHEHGQKLILKIHVPAMYNCLDKLRR